MHAAFVENFEKQAVAVKNVFRAGDRLFGKGSTVGVSRSATNKAFDVGTKASKSSNEILSKPPVAQQQFKTKIIPPHLPLTNS